MDKVTGPALDTYIETRLNLLTKDIEKDNQTAKDSLKAFTEAAHNALTAAKAAADAAQSATDLRYQQRFEAQSDALTAAFLSQQTAMQTAFMVAEKAVQAALAAADRAVSKAELAADKRFEALNELRQMLNDTLKTLMTRQEVTQIIDTVLVKTEAVGERVDSLEARFNVLTGESAGGRTTKNNQRDNMAVMIAVGAVLLQLVALMLKGHFGL